MDNGAPWRVATLTATPGEDAGSSFSLDAEDRAHPVLAARLNASKPARLVEVAKQGTAEDEDDDTERGDPIRRIAAIAEEVGNALRHFKNGANVPPAQRSVWSLIAWREPGLYLSD